MEAPTQEISGTVENVTYHSDVTGYTVCSVVLASETVGKHGRFAKPETATIVGNCAAIWVGEELRATGQWVNHSSHGRQFKADSITCIAPTSIEGIKRYLASGMIRGIGKVHADRIVAYFGERTLEIIDKESARLEEVEGIAAKRRKLIKDSWNEQRGTRDIMIFLQGHGIGTAQSAKIFRTYGHDAIAIVKQNPYRLCRDIWGIGFKTADTIASRVGVPRVSPVRARAGLIYTLQTQAEEGHCFCIEADLLLQANALLDISVDILAEALREEISTHALVKHGDRVYLNHLAHAEKRAAKKLRALLDTPANFPPIDVERALKWIDTRLTFKLADRQKEALSVALSSKVSIITGGPGVGKTTIIRALVDMFKVRKLNVRLAAPTGRASRRMSEATGADAQTLHRLLKYNPQFHRFEHNAENPLAGDVFILDEMSMVDIILADQFLDALPDSAHLVLVGDTDQLPSVGPGNVLRDLIASGAIPYCKLDTIFRQDKTGLIVRNAHHINRGEPFETSASAESDFYFIETAEPETIIKRAVELMTQRIPNKFRMDPLTDVQVLTPMRKNLLGTENLNDVIQKALNPEGPSLLRGCTHYRRGDRVMQMRNNYDKEVFNGDIGFIKEVHEGDRMLVVMFDGRPVRYEQSELDELVLAYACSIHKSQGSEYAAVIVLMHTQHFKLLQRNLLYTAITRGKKLVLVVGSSRAVNIAIRANQVRERRTTLQSRISIQGEP